mgnify:CR=1 FL=1
MTLGDLTFDDLTWAFGHWNWLKVMTTPLPSTSLLLMTQLWLLASREMSRCCEASCAWCHCWHWLDLNNGNGSVVVFFTQFLFVVFIKIKWVFLLAQWRASTKTDRHMCEQLASWSCSFLIDLSAHLRESYLNAWVLTCRNVTITRTLN